MARANPQWHTFRDGEVTVVFNGPHAYITPEWYLDSEGEVPTWNYSVVHVRGNVEIIEDSEGIIECLKALSTHAEKLWPSGWQFSIPEDLMGEALTKGIVEFKIKIVEIDFKMKLSQNRIREDRLGVARGLADSAEDRSYELLNSMLDLYLTEDKRFI
jgi:transcriptional regulator